MKFLFLSLLMLTFSRTAVVVAAEVPAVGDDIVTAALKPIRQKYDVPAMAAAVVTSDGLRCVGAVGVRKRGGTEAVTLADLWHLGSDTKAMTSALAARLVERGKLRWDMTLPEMFPDLAREMHAISPVTLAQLLAHRSGLQANVDLAEYAGDDAAALRLRAVRAMLTQPPQSRPGSFTYSNLGYVIVGAAMERAAGQTWERAVVAEIFQPLKMTSAGFGGTGTPGRIDQPWPHTEDGKPTPSNGPTMDNPPIYGPAGRVHCTIQDWARFVQDQLRGARGEPALLKPESYRRMHTPLYADGAYALGWSTADRDWGGGKVLNHVGDNTMNLANVLIAPKKNFAILVCVNQSGKPAYFASDEAVSALLKALPRAASG